MVYSEAGELIKGGMEECTLAGREQGVGTWLCICLREISGVCQLEAG